MRPDEKQKTSAPATRSSRPRCGLAGAAPTVTLDEALLLVTHLGALRGRSAALVATREPELDSVLKLLRDDDSNYRLLVAGRQRLHDAGARPWAVVGDGWLSFDWWTREEFAAALARWAEGPE